MMMGKLRTNPGNYEDSGKKRASVLHNDLFILIPGVKKMKGAFVGSLINF